ncbi:MAG: hypothetical protein ACI4FZ_01220 [Lachnospiraceae bacterium]
MENTILYTLIGICMFGCITRLLLAGYYKSLLHALKSMRRSKNKTAAALREQFILRYQAMLGVENVDFFVGRFLSERKLFGISLTTWNGLHTQFVSLCLLIGAVSAFALVVQDAEVTAVLRTMFHGIWTSTLLIFVDGFCMIGGKAGALRDGLCDYLENYLKVRLEHEYKVWGRCEQEEKPSKAVLEAQLQIMDAKAYQKQKKQEVKELRSSEQKNRRQAAYAARVEEKMRREQEKLQKREEKLRKKLREEALPVYRSGKSTEGQNRVRKEAELLKREVEERRRREAEAAAAREQTEQEKSSVTGQESHAAAEEQKSEQDQVNELLKEFLIRC